jgi:dynein intermediate chain 1
MPKKMPKKKGGDDAPPAPPPPQMDDDDIYQEPTKKIVIPANQLQLSEKELAEEITRVLTANDPNVPSNITKYNYKDRTYKVDPPGPGDHLKIHFTMDGSAMHKDSDDAKSQQQAETKKKDAEEEAKQAAAEEAKDAGDTDLGTTETGKNQFNYSERAAQTFNNPLRDKGVSTEPPPVMSFAATISQWEIYDSYMESYDAQEREKEQQAKLAGKKPAAESKEGEGDAAAATATDKDDDMVHSAAMGKSLKIMERMVNQNAEDEIFQDFKYWEDASDQFRDGEGSLLPLWRFSTERTKRKQVTALCWNPAFPDLFAVGYGSYDFMRQGSGIICCFSLKNTSHPEYTFSTESGVMCLDFHPQHHSLLAVGCYDGTVMVYDVRHKVNRPIYASSIKTGKHTDPVWQVGWQEEDLAKELNFFSISSDGRVANWIMSKNELKMEPVMQLKLVNTMKEDPEETSLSGLAGGCCFDFNKTSEHLFIVGTEEGKIHKCSKAYSGQYLETYEGHHMAVYAVKWNPYHPRVFISSSADWTVKLWDHNVQFPIMSFDLGNAVGDVAWGPYSSTVFAAVTSDGKVHVFDLKENKHEPLCEQKVVKRAKLTHVAFNNRDPIILVGDDRGGVNSLKLSPNLRKIVSNSDDVAPEDAVSQEQLEIQKVEKLLVASDTSKPE